jgi:hypothetical protein
MARSRSSSSLGTRTTLKAFRLRPARNGPVAGTVPARRSGPSSRPRPARPSPVAVPRGCLLPSPQVCGAGSSRRPRIDSRPRSCPPGCLACSLSRSARFVTEQVCTSRDRPCCLATKCRSPSSSIFCTGWGVAPWRNLQPSPSETVAFWFSKISPPQRGPRTTAAKIILGIAERRTATSGYKFSS